MPSWLQLFSSTLRYLRVTTQGQCWYPEDKYEGQIERRVVGASTFLYIATCYVQRQQNNVRGKPRPKDGLLAKDKL